MKNSFSKIYLDIEANCSENKEDRKNSEILQLSAIKIDCKGNKFEFNEYCYNDHVYERISNLLEKEKDFFKNKKFLNEKDLYKKFFEFSKDSKIYTFGNFDQFVIERTYKRNFKKNEIPLIKTIDMQEKIARKIGMKKSPSLKLVANTLDIEYKNNHDGLCDAIVLYKIINKINDETFDNKMYKDKIEMLKYLPNLTSKEYVDFKKNNFEYKLKNNFNIIYININEYKKANKMYSKLDINEDDDIILSNSLIDELSKEELETHISITFCVLNSNLTLIDKFEESKNFEKEKMINYDDYKCFVNVEKSIQKYSNDLFLINNKKILILFSKKMNRQFFIWNYKEHANDLKFKDKNFSEKGKTIIKKIQKSCIENYNLLLQK